MVQRARMRALTWTILAVGAVLAALAVASISTADQPSTTSPPSTTAPAPTLPPTVTAPITSGRVDCTATTDGRDPEKFTPACRGPVQVAVTGRPRCLDDVGDGWEAAWTVTNRGRRMVVGTLVATVDDRPPVVAQARLQVPAGGEVRGLVRLPGLTGDGLVVTLLPPTGDPVNSFPVELPHCHQDPADLRQADRVTTTT